jgi:hypothetical protein
VANSGQKTKRPLPYEHQFATILCPVIVQTHMYIYYTKVLCGCLCIHFNPYVCWCGLVWNLNEIPHQHTSMHMG